MTQPQVSVVIPAYNQADYLGEAINSVLNQTYQNLELIVVNDASPDHTEAVVKQFNDPRLKYIVHEKNRHLAASRNTGMRAASGEIIALLDADDYFHPEKLARHVEFLQRYPHVGVTYNGRFEVDPNGNVISIWNPPASCNLADMVMGFPFAPSDMVLRREWAFRVNLFDEQYVYFSEDLDINCRLALANCKFAHVGPVLNYRRYYPGRIIYNSANRLEAAVHALEKTFQSPACPPEVKQLQAQALANTYMIWSYETFIADQSELGQSYIHTAARLNPAILSNQAPHFLNFLVFRSTQDGGEHEPLLRKVFSQLPQDLAWILTYADSTIAGGYFNRAIREILWGQPQNSVALFRQGLSLGGQIEDLFLRKVVDQLLEYELVFGENAAHLALENLVYNLQQVSSKKVGQRLQGLYNFNSAFRNYRSGKFSKVPGQVLRAMSVDKNILRNWGAISILFRSLVYSISFVKQT